MPSGLAPGDHYHLAFVTSFTTGIDTSVPPPAYPSFGGVAAADWIIMDTANSAGYIPDWNFSNVTWKAILSTSTVDARDHINVQGPVYNTRGELVATGAADLWDGTIAHAIKYDENGGDIFSNLNVWSGSTSLGIFSGGACVGYTSNSGSCASGNLTRANSEWISANSLSCSSAGRLYGISPLLTVPVPGDYNGNGTADAADYVVWRHGNGPPADYDLWRTHFGESLPASGTATTETTAIPEPSSLALLSVLTVILTAVKRIYPQMNADKDCLRHSSASICVHLRFHPSLFSVNSVSPW